MKIRTILWLVCLVFVLISLFFVSPPKQTEYSYDVKVQQVYDVDRVEDGDVTEFKNLREDEQKVLYEAFKEIETGQMLSEDGAEVRVTFNEQRASFNTWKTVEMKGVVMIVAIDENSTTLWDTSIPWVFWWGLAYIFSALYVVFGVFKALFAPSWTEPTY